MLFSSLCSRPDAVSVLRYLEDNNARIEEGFKNGQDPVMIHLGRRRLSVFFTPGSTFALQRDTQRHKERAVRRVVKSRQANTAASCLPPLLPT